MSLWNRIHCTKQNKYACDNKNEKYYKREKKNELDTELNVLYTFGACFFISLCFWLAKFFTFCVRFSLSFENADESL